MLEIMRDSRLGTGGLALIVLVAKVLVVGELLLRDIHPIAGGGLRRSRMAVLLMYRHRYARKRGWAICLSAKLACSDAGDDGDGDRWPPPCWGYRELRAALIPSADLGSGMGAEANPRRADRGYPRGGD